MEENRKNRMIENGMTFVGLMGSLVTIPQIIKVFITHPAHASALSLATWSGYWIIGALWVAYGVHFKKRAILISNSVYLVMYTLVIIGIATNTKSAW